MNDLTQPPVPLAPDDLSAAQIQAIGSLIVEPAAKFLRESQQAQLDASTRQTEINALTERGAFSKTVCLCIAILALGGVALFRDHVNVTQTCVAAVVGFIGGYFAGRAKR